MRKNAKEEVLMKCILKRQVLNCSKKFIVALAIITPPRKPWSVKLSEQDSIGRPPWPMQRS
jgi:hypothetical protein